MSEIVSINIIKPSQSDWKDMSDEYGWVENDFVLNTPIGKYAIGKRKTRNGEVRWWFTDNINYHYAIKGREYPNKSEAMSAAWEHYKQTLQRHTY